MSKSLTFADVSKIESLLEFNASLDKETGIPDPETVDVEAFEKMAREVGVEIDYPLREWLRARYLAPENKRRADLIREQRALDKMDYEQLKKKAKKYGIRRMTSEREVRESIQEQITEEIYKIDDENKIQPMTFLPVYLRKKFGAEYDSLHEGEKFLYEYLFRPTMARWNNDSEYVVLPTVGDKTWTFKQDNYQSLDHNKTVYIASISAVYNYVDLLRTMGEFRANSLKPNVSVDVLAIQSVMEHKYYNVLRLMITGDSKITTSVKGKKIILLSLVDNEETSLLETALHSPINIFRGGDFETELIMKAYEKSYDLARLVVRKTIEAYGGKNYDAQSALLKRTLSRMDDTAVQMIYDDLRPGEDSEENVDIDWIGIALLLNSEYIVDYIINREATSRERQVVIDIIRSGRVSAHGIKYIDKLFSAGLMWGYHGLGPSLDINDIKAGMEKLIDMIMGRRDSYLEPAAIDASFDAMREIYRREQANGEESEEGEDD